MLRAELRNQNVRMASGYQPLVLVFLAFAAGIVLDRYCPLPAGWLWSASATALLAWWLLWRQGRDQAATAVLLVALASFGAARHHVAWHLFSATDIGLAATEVGGPVCLEGVVAETPRTIPAPAFTPLRAFSVGERSRCRLQAAQLRDGRTWRPAAGNVLLTVDGALPDVRAGDRVRVFGRLLAPRATLNPGEFDFARHERAAGRLAQVWTTFPQCVDRVQPQTKFAPVHWLDDARVRSRKLLERYVDPNQFGLASTLVLGQREGLDLETNEQFLETGTIHVLAISGLHVGMVAAAVFALLRIGWLPRNAALCIVALVTIGYALLTDTGAPVTRATMLVVLTCLALGTGRAHSVVNALAAAALLVVLLNPADLFRTGPQLSFLSVAAILCFAPRIAAWGRIDDPLDRLIANSRPWPLRAARLLLLRTGQALLFSTAIWASTSLMVMSQFHLLTPIAVVLNLFLWIPVAVALLSGLGVIVFGVLFPPAAMLCGGSCSRALSAMDAVVAWGSQMPLGHFWLPGPSNWWLLGLYLSLAVWWLAPQLAPPMRWRLALLAVWIACGLLDSPQAKSMARPLGSAALRLPAADLRCTFLSVGHGLAVVLELPDGKVLLYDAGQLGSPTAASRTIAGYLWSRGITHIDAVIVSHADLDHFNAIPALVERFSIGAAYVSPMMFEQPSASLTALSEAFAKHDIHVDTLAAGDRLRAGSDYQLEVLHPTRIGVLGSDNANSMVLAVECQGRRILLTGDLESPGLEAVLAELPYDCDVLLAPHHGSFRSNPAGMAQWSQPEHVIMSGGHDIDPQVFDAYGQAGAQVLHTAAVGAITVLVRGGDLQIETHRPPLAVRP